MSFPPAVPESTPTQQEFNKRASTAANRLQQRVSGTGPTAERPKAPDTGTMFWDTTLGCAIFWTGTGWVKSAVVAA